MFSRVIPVILCFSAAAMAGSKPVCPGPAAPGKAHCHSHVNTDETGNPLAAAAPSGYGPVQFRTGYGLTASGTSSTTIAVVDAYDDPAVENDLGVYNAQFGLPKCTTVNGCFKKVNQTGGTRYPAKNAGWILEISLDVQIAHAICPNCKILLVEANSNSFADLLQ